MPIIEKAAEVTERTLEQVSIEVDRHSLQKCRWRRAAQDGVEFAFCLEDPLRNGDIVLETDRKRYQVIQFPEPVFSIPLPTSPDQSARLGWSLGNLHQPVEIRNDCLLVAGDPGIQRVLDDLSLAYEDQFEIFNPPPHSAAHSHDHLGFDYEHSHGFFSHSHASIR
tara:strand:- start:1935 stop:2432 length:498 start_codon:yes stop_codon:yes gene_type:complete